MVARMPFWTWAAPAAAWLFLLLPASLTGSGVHATAAGLALIATVFAAVHHAEVVAHRTGEPFGTLVLAVAVTVIEVALIVSVMISAPAEKMGLARDTVFAAVIVMNGIVGLCLLLGGIRHHQQGFQAHGANAGLAVLAALTTLTLVLPNLVATASGPMFNTSQLVFTGFVSLVLYCAYVFVQTVSHRDDFLTPETGDQDQHAASPSNSAAVISGCLLVVALVAVVGLAKSLTPEVEGAIRWFGLPEAVVGIVIAAVVLLPECVAALRAANDNRLQTSLNLALGSVLAAIGLTIPVVALVSILIGKSMPIKSA